VIAVEEQVRSILLMCVFPSQRERDSVRKAVLKMYRITIEYGWHYKYGWSNIMALLFSHFFTKFDVFIILLLYILILPFPLPIVCVLGVLCAFHKVQFSVASLKKI
jgi:hypothetical protein